MMPAGRILGVGWGFSALLLPISSDLSSGGVYVALPDWD
jgi:hypothetical protein